MKQLQRLGKLSVHLYDNALNGKKEEYFGKITLRGSITTEDLAETLVEQGIGFTKEEILNIARSLSAAALEYVADGFSVKLDLCTVRASLSGIFKGANTSFNPETNMVTICYIASKQAREAIKKAEVVVEGTASRAMVINRVLDVKSGEENSSLTRGRPIKIYGTRLTVEGNDPQVGVWFINAADERQRIPVEQNDMVDNNPSQLTVVVPFLDDGEWYIEIITQSTANKSVMLRETRKTRYELPLEAL